MCGVGVSCVGWVCRVWGGCVVCGVGVSCVWGGCVMCVGWVCHMYVADIGKLTSVLATDILL